jgi:hypothetical protein
MGDVNMILVRKVEVVETDGYIAQIAHAPNGNFNDSFDLTERLKLETEDIYAKEFCLPDKRRVWIGWSKQVHEALNIPLQCIENQSRQIENLHGNLEYTQKKIEDKQKELKTMKNWSWFRRLKFLFMKK